MSKWWLIRQANFSYLIFWPSDKPKTSQTTTINQFFRFQFCRPPEMGWWIGWITVRPVRMVRPSIWSIFWPNCWWRRGQKNLVKIWRFNHQFNHFYPFFESPYFSPKCCWITPVPGETLCLSHGQWASQIVTLTNPQKPRVVPLKS